VPHLKELGGAVARLAKCDDPGVPDQSPATAMQSLDAATTGLTGDAAGAAWGFSSACERL
jgi:hypothetical protein